MSDYIPNNVLEFFSHTLTAARVPDIGAREPILTVGYKINESKPQYSNAFIRVTHFIRGEEKNKYFEAKTSVPYVVAALEQLIAYANKPFDGKKEIMSWSIKGPKIVNGKMSNERIVTAKIAVGRNEKGPFISVVHWNNKYPRIAFYPGLVDERNIANEASDSVERTYEFVAANARGWATTVLKTLIESYNRDMDSVIRGMKSKGGGNRSNNDYGNGNYSGKGNYSKSDSSYDSSSTDTSQDADADYSDFNF